MSRSVADPSAARRNETQVAAVPYARRLLLLPHCLRRVDRCRAREVGYQYLCADCGACPVGPIRRKAMELGYLGVCVLKGGRAIIRLIEEQRPGAVLGVACLAEGVAGIEVCERLGIPVAFLPLSKDGCANTEVDLDACFRFLEALTEAAPIP